MLKKKKALILLFFKHQSRSFHPYHYMTDLLATGRETLCLYYATKTEVFFH